MTRVHRLVLLVVVCLPIIRADAKTDGNCHGDEESCRKGGEGNSEPLKALPASSSDTATLKLGESMSLGDQMGPLVINEDGTTRRIANWAEMTETEKANIMRLITKRNAQRLKKIADDRKELVEIAEENSIIPDVVEDVSAVVYSDFDVGYRDIDPSTPFKRVKMGTEFTPAQVRDAPTIWWPSPATQDRLYAIIMVDPDAPSREAPSMRHWLHWLLVDVTGHCTSRVCEFDTKESSKGVEVARYSGSTPPKGTGFHRYVFLIYEQTRPLAGEEGLAPGGMDGGRGRFELSSFCETYGLRHPKGIKFFVAKS